MAAAADRRGACRLGQLLGLCLLGGEDDAVAHRLELDPLFHELPLVLTPLVLADSLCNCPLLCGHPAFRAKCGAGCDRPVITELVSSNLFLADLTVVHEDRLGYLCTTNVPDICESDSVRVSRIKSFGERIQPQAQVFRGRGPKSSTRKSDSGPNFVREMRMRYAV